MTVTISTDAEHMKVVTCPNPAFKFTVPDWVAEWVVEDPHAKKDKLRMLVRLYQAGHVAGFATGEEYTQRQIRGCLGIVS
jgi:hypothetical protein